MDVVTDRVAQVDLERTWPPVRRRALTRAIEKAQSWLLQRQSAEGFWVGELEADASVAAGYITVMFFMRGTVDRFRQRKVLNYVFGRQNGDGSWSAYHGGPGDVSVSVQVYLACKIAGVAADDPRMQRARNFILSAGGIGKVNVITRVWLALFGQFDWRWTPAVPPELMLLPKRFILSLYDFASWSRATIVALALLWATKPVCRLPRWARIDELYAEPPEKRHYPVGQSGGILSWRRLFLVLDALFKAYDHLPLQPGRRCAIRRATRWVLEHQEKDGSWGGILLPWIYSLMALKTLGYPLDHPAIERGMEGLEGFIIEDENTLRLQPATSPVWDTAWAVLALSESGLSADHPSLQRAARWLLSRQIRVAGDWQIKNPHTEPGCWSFEFVNEQYPDMDDTAVVSRALRRVWLPVDEEKAKQDAIARAIKWVVDMQSRDGGWAAFDRDNDKRILDRIPFSDFMSPLDPTCADVTAHVIELVGEVGEERALQRALGYLANAQEADGAWYGRWGVNYVYGTSLALTALGSLGPGVAPNSQKRGIEWLLEHQNPDGGWGESCRTYHDPNLRGCGLSTPSQTAWALCGLLAAGAGLSQAAARAVEFLLNTQQPDGSWAEDAYTGTGFPRAFYLKYELYCQYFPLLALARYQAGLPEASS